MRESIGGAWLFGIVIVFIFFFSGFLAYSISYTKAFNVKNNIISVIEENEGYSVDDGDLASKTDEELKQTVEGKAYRFIKQSGYNFSGAQGLGCEGIQNNAPNVTTEGGYCIVKYCPNGTAISNTHYKVTTFIVFKIPVININVKIPISGETRTIYSDQGSYSCTVGVD